MINQSYTPFGDDRNSYLSQNESTDSIISSGVTSASTQHLSHLDNISNNDIFPDIQIHRPILFTENFYPINPAISKTNKQSCLQNIFNPIKSLFSSKKSKTSKPKPPFSVYAFLCSVLPIVKWTSTYDLRRDLTYDIIAGVTILALHIPQGLAYGKLAGVEPIYGLYVSLFPVVVYAIFGGSRQISIGTFAVISIACRDAIEQVTGKTDLVDSDQFFENLTLSPDSVMSFLSTDSIETATTKIPPIEILTSLCLFVGLIQLLLGVLRLGVLATILSDPIISSYCLGASIHVFTSQIFAVFDISSDAGPNEPEIPFELARSYYRLFSRITSANPATIIISVSTMSVLIACKSYLEPYLMRRFKLKSVAIPIDILSIIALTLISSLVDFNGRYHVSLIPKITAGFTGMPAMPRFDLFPALAPSAILLAFICYASTYSLEKLYARKYGYQVYPNQELLALGTANVISSFFLCYPSCGSLSRSAVQDKVGGRTQLSGIISSILIVIFMLFLSQYLQTLPKCALSCIIIVALISTFKKAAEFVDYWTVSKLDGLVWLATVVLVVLFGVDYGMIYALVVGLAMLIFRLAIPTFNLKYHISNTECYLDSSRMRTTQSAQSSTNIFIFEFHGPLLFINVERFTSGFKSQILETLEPEQNPHMTMIFDLSQIPYLDGKAVECILEMDAELRKQGYKLYLACASKTVLDTMILCRFFESFHVKHCFLTVHDAVVYANK